MVVRKKSRDVTVGVVPKAMEGIKKGCKTRRTGWLKRLCRCVRVKKKKWVLGLCKGTCTRAK
jgi:hypothetical protein